MTKKNELMPFAREVYPGKGYVLTMPYAYRVDIPGECLTRWVRLIDGVLHAARGYQWNGANVVRDTTSSTN